MMMTMMMMIIIIPLASAQKRRMSKYLGIRQACNVQNWPTHMPLKYSLICNELEYYA
jgi:hypothetical protein